MPKCAPVRLVMLIAYTSQRLSPTVHTKSGRLVARGCNRLKRRIYYCRSVEPHLTQRTEGGFGLDRNSLFGEPLAALGVVAAIFGSRLSPPKPGPS